QLGRIGDFVLNESIILGHEPSGVVSALGEGVTSLKIGDRVAVEPGVPCRRCDRSKEGRYNLCPKITFPATPPYQGTLTRYYVHEADFCYKLSDNVSCEEGAMLKPLAVGLHACLRANIAIGSRVLVCEAGTIGLVSLLCAKAMGAPNVVVTDICESRLAVAKAMGADGTVNVMGKDPKTCAAEVIALLGRPTDSAIECSGAEASAYIGIYATKSGGTFVLIGMGPEEAKVPLINALVREIDIRGVFRFVNSYATAFEMIANGKVNVEQLITHRYPLEQALEAFETARTGKDGAIKVIINCGR
ncbi:Sorbitol dehydrogenase, partial [Hypsibius exemplaris]